MSIRWAIRTTGWIRRTAAASPKRSPTSSARCSPPTPRTFAQRYADFDKRLTAAEKGWEAKMAPYKGRKVITYHRSWPNFCERFGLEVVDYVEPKPGIPPTPSHTLELINTMKRENIKLILVEPYFDLRTPNSIAQATSAAQVVVLMPRWAASKRSQTTSSCSITISTCWSTPSQS